MMQNTKSVGICDKIAEETDHLEVGKVNLGNNNFFMASVADMLKSSLRDTSLLQSVDNTGFLQMIQSRKRQGQDHLDNNNIMCDFFQDNQ